MNNVHAVVLRSAGSCLRLSPWSKPFVSLFRSSSPSTPCRLLPTTILGFGPQRETIPRRIPLRPFDLSRSFSSSASNRITPTPVRGALGPLKPQEEVEKGLAFSSEPLTPEELHDVYGTVVPLPEGANRLLKVLHGRRVDGTLDLPLPADLQSLTETYPYAVESALYWLRENFEVDEEEAVVARVDREESGYDGRTPSQLRQRAQDLRLLAPQSSKFDGYRKVERPTIHPEYYGPQSGRYQAKLSAEGDVFGESEIEKIRAKNDEKFEIEEKELDKQIEGIQTRRMVQAEEEKTRALAMKPEQSLEASEQEIRPPNEYERWVLKAKNKGVSNLTLESPEIKDRTLASRLLPSLAFVVLVGAGCWLLSQSWQPPKRSERLWPNVSLSFATVAGIMSVNFTIFVLWRFPPLWRLLNRYFLVVPATPKPLSLLGNTFSHVQHKHLIFNMLPLLVFGPSLHEDLGRGNFMALYLFSGVVASYASLTHHAVRGILHTSSLGASGSVWAVTAAFFNIHSDNDFTVFFMPEEWKDTVHIKGWMLFAGLIVLDIFSGIRGKPVTVDYIAHASGALTGWVLASWFKWRQSQIQNKEFAPKNKLPWWQILLQEGNNPDKGRS